MNRLFSLKTYKKTYKKCTKNTILVKFVWENCLFFASEWANEPYAQKTSDLLIHSFTCWPEGIPHGRSFAMSDMRDLLTVAHLSWAIGENCSQSLIWCDQFEQMSKWATERWANERIPNPDYFAVGVGKTCAVQKRKTFLLLSTCQSISFCSVVHLC